MSLPASNQRSFPLKPIRVSHLVLLAAAAVVPTPAIRAQDTSSPLATPAKVSFSTAQKSFIKSVTGGLQILTAGDVNGDGNTDLIVQGDNGGSNLMGVHLLIGDGKGGFSPVQTTGLPSCYNCAYNTVRLIDLNADGKLDLVLINWGSEYEDAPDGICEKNSGFVTLYLGDGKGDFRQTYSTSLSEVARSNVIADFNNDGKPDFAFYSTLSGAGCYSSTKSLNVLMNNGDGTLGASHSVTIPQSEVSGVVHVAATSPTNGESGTRFDALASGDFNHDGKVDLALIRFDTTTGNFTKIIDVLNGKGNGTFDSGPKYTFAERPIALYAADFNHDGRTDLVVSLFSDSLGKFRIATLYAKQSQGFYWSSATAYKDSYAYLALADFNADGNLDLIVTPGANFYSFTMLTNNGSGGFPSPYNLSIASTGTDTSDPIYSIPLKKGDKPSIIAGTPFNGGSGNAAPAFVVVFTNQSK